MTNLTTNLERNRKHRLAWAAALAMLAAPAAWGADGLRLPTGDEWFWPGWQARLTLTTAGGPGAATVRQASLLGDYYLRSDWLPQTGSWRGGLRATSGLVLGDLGRAVAVMPMTPLSVSLLSLEDPGRAGNATAVWPYLGIGYSGLSTDGGLSFSADLGLVVRNPSAAFGNGLSGAWRQLDLTPMVRFGVRYAF